MDTPGEGSSRAKRANDKALALHRELNPHPGSSILIAIDRGNGQLFFCARSGSCVARDEAARRYREEMLRYAYPGTDVD